MTVKVTEEKGTKMFRAVTFIVVFCSLFFAIDATAEESLELRISNRDFRPSHSQMIEMLKEADLESHGYEKQVTSSLTQMPGSDEKSYERTHLYYKIVSCSQLQEIYQEIHRLLPGAFESDMVMKYEKEVKYSHLDSMQLCRAGVEVHFRDDRCHENGKISECRQKRGYGDVVVCEVVKGVVVV